jgi:hypothetical protein
MKKSKIIQRKLFFATRTLDGFEIVKYGPDKKLRKISQRDLLSINKALEENSNIPIGEKLTLFVNVYDDQPSVSININYEKLAPGQVDPQLQ